MKDEEILDPFNEFNLAAFHYVFWPAINDNFDAKHRMPTSLGIWSDELYS